MQIHQLHLQNFRNYESLTLDFHPNLNIFLGQNAQGKTNILESLYFLALTRSHRTSHEAELIKWEAENLAVRAEVEKGYNLVPLELQLNKKKRLAKVNHLTEKRIADYIGQLNVVMFAPEDLDLIKGAPAQRRRFLDMEIGQSKSIYLYTLARYNRVLRERNAYLKEHSEYFDPIFFDVLDNQFVEFAEKIMEIRSIFVEKLEKIANQIHQQLTQNKEVLRIQYLRNSEGNFTENLKLARQRDLARHQSTIGPHRDDLQFFINDINVSRFASQGQQRTVTLSIKLAEIEILKEETGEYPLLLLDDVMSELDNTRQLDLLQTAIGKAQTFLTSTTLDHLKKLPKEMKIFHIKAGQIDEA
ncbi:MAG: DNA replication/repair protein RecF [Lactovum sp.]